MAHRILIIDDDKVSTALVKFTLEKKGYEVCLANDGAVGLSMMMVTLPDLIILDVCMPNMNGYEFMTELKRSHTKEMPPVIMLTGSETMKDIFELEAVRGYFLKPVVVGELLKKIELCIGANPV